MGDNDIYAENDMKSLSSPLYCDHPRSKIEKVITLQRGNL